MASTVLPNGIIIPEKYSRDWYADLYHNWQELDNLLGGGTPKDGTLTIQKNGDTVGTFSANQATDETINIEVPDVNNGTLTIQQNGTTVDTFTANSSTDKTVDITVPTKTSDLTNDSGFITEDTTKIPLAGSNQISGSLIPATTDAYDLGGSSYQWNNAYIKSLTINGVACGDILTHNASEFVNVTSNQTIGGRKIFSNGQTGVGRDLYHFTTIPYGKNTPPANASYQYLWFTGNTASQGFTNSWYGSYIELVIDTDGSAHGSWVIRNISGNKMGIQLSESADGSSSSIIPIAGVDLGTSTNKWKSLNGINPGALSLPSGTYINVDTTNWDLTCQNTLLGSFTPTADGWLMLHVANSGTSEVNFWVIGGVIRINNKSSINTTDNNNFNMFTIPVEKDVTYNIYGNASEYVAGRSIKYCRFMPCRGNV